MLELFKSWCNISSRFKHDLGNVMKDSMKLIGLITGVAWDIFFPLLASFRFPRYVYVSATLRSVIVAPVVPFDVG